MATPEMMVSRIFTLVISFFSAITATAQQPSIDSLKSELVVSKNDTINLILFGKIANGYSEINPDSSYHYASKMLLQAKKLELKMEEAVALGEMGYAMLNMGNYPRSLQALLQSISISEDPDNERNILPSRFPAIDEFTNRSVPARMQRLSRLSRVQQYAAILYGNSGNYEKALRYYRTAIPLATESNSLQVLSIIHTTLGRTYLSLNKKDSALFSLQKGYEYAIQAGYHRYVGSILLNMGRVYVALGNRPPAKVYFKRALTESTENDYFRGIVASNLVLAEMYKESGLPDSSLYHIKNGLRVANYLNGPELLLRCYTALADFYRTVNSDSTVKYQSLIIKINNETFNTKQAQQFQNIDFDEQQRLNEIETARKEFQSRLRTNVLMGSTFTLVVIAFFLYRNNRTKQKAKQNIEKAYDQLKSTQSQLIQSEKMASLGELTAGIAHEIQNPLNFVNNFSEVSNELLDEMTTNLASGKTQTATELARDVKQNLEKILHHGKRADAIVKGMLQHSRSSSGVKEATDINALADEYLRLAYHGLRAKDKSFNATMKTDFDSSIGTINVIPQDIGRVIPNLIMNAFYAVTEKKSTFAKATADKETKYEPTVTVSTKRVGPPLGAGGSAGRAGMIEISVKDNGPGIPPKILDKIFQPFFTTKPTGQGTGLGLSLSYDIVKAHGGELKVKTKESEGSEFIINLPRTPNA